MIIDHATEAEWLATRTTGIGSSDAPAVMGVSSYSSAYEVACRKRGLLPDIEATERMRWGHLHEPACRAEVERESGWSVEHSGPYAVVRAVNHPHMLASLDGIIHHPERGPGALEIKTREFCKESELLDVDAHPRSMWHVQHQHQMVVLGVDWGVLAVLMGGCRFRWMVVERDPALTERIIAAEREFWERHERGELPPPDGSEATARAIKALHPNDDGSTVALDDATAADWEEMSLWVERRKEAESNEDRAKNAVLAAMGAATFGVLPSGVRLSLKTQSRKEFVSKATTFRTLRREK